MTPLDPPLATAEYRAVEEREWPGMQGRDGEAHGDYRPGYMSRWCASCGGYHGASYVGCNGLRDVTSARCPAVIGEVRCDRPEGHLYEHKADSEAMRIEWRMKQPRGGDHG